jgi:hypothetical protein
MQAINSTSEVLQDSEALDARASAPQHRLARLPTSLRASMALVTGRNPCGERQVKARRDESELDLVEHGFGAILLL